MSLLLLLACAEALVSSGAPTGLSDTELPTDSDSAADPVTVEQVGGVEQPPDLGPTQEALYDPNTIHDLALELPQASLDGLALDPDRWVRADLHYQGNVWPDVGVHLKGNSSFRTQVEKPALKIKVHAFDKNQRFGEVERLTLNNNVNEPSMMAETLAYRTYRHAGSPAPRTGYAHVTLNGVALGLYTLVESMDDQYVRFAWPDSTGTLYEPSRGCDLNEDISCYGVDQAGSSHEPDELQVVHDAAVGVDFGPLWDHVDSERVLAYFAAERFTAHEDSYSFNDNNHHLFYEPDGARVSLSPWGADSTFVYRYPVDLAPGYPCESKLEAIGKTPSGHLASRCGDDAACAAALEDALLDLADAVEVWDLVAFAGQVGAVIRDAAGAEQRQGHSLVQFDDRVRCHQEWIEARPQSVRDYLAQ
jgi:hypothetical protein